MSVMTAGRHYLAPGVPDNATYRIAYRNMRGEVINHDLGYPTMAAAHASLQAATIRKHGLTYWLVRVPIQCPTCEGEGGWDQPRWVGDDNPDRVFCRPCEGRGYLR